MRTAWPPSVLAALLVWTGSTCAQPTPSTITVPDAQVRSGPSPEFYPTSRLHRGDKVRVVREEATGWLAIEPPPDSLSWIDSRLVEVIGPTTAVVSAPEAQIWVGSRLINSKPTVWRTKVKRGTQVTITARAQRDADGIWLPILPVPSEVRYLSAEATRATAAPQQFAVASAEPPKVSSSPVGFASPERAVRFATPGQPAAAGNPALSPQAPSSVTDPRWLRAEQAERAGDIVGAKELYQQLADQVKTTDHDLWVRCLNRIQTLEDRRPDRFTAPPASLATASSSGTAKARLVPSPSGGLAGSAMPRASSEYCYQPESGYTARLSPPRAAAPSPPSGQWSEPGWLCRTAFKLDGTPLLCLQPLGPNKSLIYASPGANVNLEPYVNRYVYLYGIMVYNSDLRSYYMTVQRAQLLR
jgi:hypothetical protein